MVNGCERLIREFDFLEVINSSIVHYFQGCCLVFYGSMAFTGVLYRSIEYVVWVELGPPEQ